MLDLIHSSINEPEEILRNAEHGRAIIEWNENVISSIVEFNINGLEIFTDFSKRKCELIKDKEFIEALKIVVKKLSVLGD